MFRQCRNDGADAASRPIIRGQKFKMALWILLSSSLLVESFVFSLESSSFLSAPDVGSSSSSPSRPPPRFYSRPNGGRGPGRNTATPLAETHERLAEVPPPGRFSGSDCSHGKSITVARELGFAGIQVRT